MKKILGTIVVLLVIEVVAIGALIYAGTFDVSTWNHDNAAVNWALDTGMTRSVEAHAKGISVPDLSGPEMLKTGMDHYAEMCVTCHGAPGVQPDEIAKGLWPRAPELARTVKEWTPAELFWITRNGVKFTAMPAWGPTHSDDKIWAIVAFLEKLPELSPAEYAAMRGAAPAEGKKEQP